MAHRVGIVGASGYGGAELVRLLAGHPAIELATVAAHSQAGEDVAVLYPNLVGPEVVTTSGFDRIDVEALTQLDLVFLATPHGPAIELGAQLYDADTKVVDLSAGFRLSAEEFATWYQEQHPRPDLLPDQPGGAVYGLTEYAREAVADATLVANPGCYVTTTLLGLLPLASAGLVEPTGIVVDGKSGTSGAGRAAKDGLHFAHVDGSIGAYGAPAHRHTGEIERYVRAIGGLDVPALSFTPHLVPMTRGLLITAYATLTRGTTQADVTAALHDRYGGEPFVHVLPPGSFPVTKAVSGSNGCQVSATVDERTGGVLVTSVTDNLGKGAAGQALQNANLMLGVDETLGLSAIGVYP